MLIFEYFIIFHWQAKYLVKYVSACMFSTPHLAMIFNVCTDVIYLSNTDFSFFFSGKHQSSNIFVFYELV